MLQRIIGVFKLDANTFEEIEADQSATGQAAIVVLVVALIAAFGSGIGSGITGESFVGSFLTTLLTALVGWVVWSAITYFVGTRFFGGEADLGEMLRVIGFAFAPQVLGIIPCIGWLIGIIWTLAAGVVATRQGLDVTTGKAILTMIVGVIFYLIIAVVIGAILGVGGALF